jgi:putative endonuclease
MVKIDRKVSNRELGARGEEICAQFLASLGMEIISRNWRCKEGEIDLIAQSKEGKYRFCEVKTRRSLSAGHPLESITPTKAQRLQRLALTWLLVNGLWGCDYSIDCMGIVITGDTHTIDYRENIL